MSSGTKRCAVWAFHPRSWAHDCSGELFVVCVAGEDAGQKLCRMLRPKWDRRGVDLVTHVEEYGDDVIRAFALARDSARGPHSELVSDARQLAGASEIELIEAPQGTTPETPTEAAAVTPAEVKIPDRAQKAGKQYQQAAEALGVVEPADREAYDQLVKAHEQAGEADALPALETWQRNLRTYRQLTGQQKNKPRAGRERGAQGLARADQIEPEHWPTRVRPRGVDE